MQRGIKFIFYVSAINDLILTYPIHHSSLMVCSLHRALCAFIQREMSCLQNQMSVNRPLRAPSATGPRQRNVLPTQVYCSADLLTLQTRCTLHPFIEAFESRGLVYVFFTAVFNHAVISLALLHTNHAAVSAPS